MNLLYTDESGSVSDSKQLFFVLAGISVFERQCFWIDNELDKIAAEFNPGDSRSVELHAGPMLKGKGFWRNFPKEKRIKAIKDALTVLCNSHISNRVFACVIKKSILTDRDLVELAFEQLSSRFDYYLRREHKKGNSQRGIIIFDKSTYETTIQNLATDFRTIGHTWDIIKNLAEVPLFIDSKASRLIQLADIVSYSIYQNYEHADNQFFSIIINRLDNDNDKTHGLCEIINS